MCVVTPVYNGARYLSECIESVIGQTYRSFEYLVVDNCSSDGSVALARRLAGDDPRIRVVAHEDHLGHPLSSANRALSLVPPGAAYVKLVHADDWLYPECLERMVGLAARHPTVGLVGAYRLDEDRVGLDGLPSTVELLPGREVARSFLLGGPLPFLFGSPTSTLLRADLVRAKPRFYNEANLHGDLEACIDVLSESDFGFVHQVLTYTRQHNEALTVRSLRIGTFAPADLSVFKRWGPILLTKDEYDRKLAARLVEYAWWLVRRPRRWLSGEFRSFHRAALRELLEGTTAEHLARGVRLQLHATHRKIRRGGSRASTSRPS